MAAGLAINCQFHPLDIVFGFYGMRYFAYLHFGTAVACFQHWDMLFQTYVAGFLLKQLHGLTAADQLPGSGMQHLDDITADIAPVNPFLLCHY